MCSKWGDIIPKSFVMNKRFMCCTLMRIVYNISKALVMSILWHYIHLENVGHDCNIFFGGEERKPWQFVLLNLSEK